MAASEIMPLFHSYKLRRKGRVQLWARNSFRQYSLMTKLVIKWVIDQSDRVLYFF